MTSEAVSWSSICCSSLSWNECCCCRSVVCRTSRAVTSSRSWSSASAKWSRSSRSCSLCISNSARRRRATRNASVARSTSCNTPGFSSPSQLSTCNLASHNFSQVDLQHREDATAQRDREADVRRAERAQSSAERARLEGEDGGRPQAADAREAPTPRTVTNRQH